MQKFMSFWKKFGPPIMVFAGIFNIAAGEYSVGALYIIIGISIAVDSE